MVIDAQSGDVSLPAFLSWLSHVLKPEPETIFQAFGIIFPTGVVDIAVECSIKDKILVI